MAEEQKPWVGVDLDGTLARDAGWKGAEHIGAVIPRMAARVRRWHNDGRRVKIFTARADDERKVNAIKKWLKDNRLPDLEITNVKDRFMVKMWDDKAVAVRKNTGLGFKDGRVAESVVKRLLGDAALAGSGAREFAEYQPAWLSPQSELIVVPHHARWAAQHVVPYAPVGETGSEGKDTGIFRAMRQAGWIRVVLERNSHLLVNPAYCSNEQMRALKNYCAEHRLIMVDEATQRDIFNPAHGD